MQEKQNKTPQQAPQTEEPVKQDPSKEGQDENTVELTEVKNASASGMGSIGRSGEPVDEEGGGEY